VGTPARQLGAHSRAASPRRRSPASHAGSAAALGQRASPRASLPLQLQPGGLPLPWGGAGAAEEGGSSSAALPSPRCRLRTSSPGSPPLLGAAAATLRCWQGSRSRSCASWPSRWVTTSCAAQAGGCAGDGGARARESAVKGLSPESVNSRAGLILALARTQARTRACVHSTS